MKRSGGEMLEKKEDRVYFYDTTLRDGAQTLGVNFNLSDKLAIAAMLDELGVSYIEGGWPGANPLDTQFFSQDIELKNATLAAFGMTRRKNVTAAEDKGLQLLLETNAPVITIVGKSWDFHVETALNISLKDNIDMVASSIAYIEKQQREAIFDAEHFFDGFLANKQFALDCVKSAYDSGARWIVLCETNGGMLPNQIGDIVDEVCQYIPKENIGIHCHDDSGNAVANSLMAVMAGARQVQGTLNGLGERCGNANILTLMANLELKSDLQTDVGMSRLNKITSVAKKLDERLERETLTSQPYVGQRAFAHKGGLHVSAIEKSSSKAYEHAEPSSVGNERFILISNQAGQSNIVSRFNAFDIDVDINSKEVMEIIDIVKQREMEGYAYDGAEASFEILLRSHLNLMPQYFRSEHFRVIDERRWDEYSNEVVSMSEAVIKLKIDDEVFMNVAEGNGPVDALDKAIRQILQQKWSILEHMVLIDYKVRILTPNDATEAVTRVFIETKDVRTKKRWHTIGVSSNIIEASYMALRDSISYFLLKNSI